MTTHKPLLRRAPLETGESLPSLLARLVHLNHYESKTVLEKLYLADKTELPECPHYLETFVRLEILTNISALQLFQASDYRLTSRYLSAMHKFKQGDEMKQLDYFYRPKRAYIRSAQDAQFCPECLSESAYHQLAWRPVAMAICLKHNRILAQGCQQCSHPVTIYDITRGRCGTCHTNLGHMNSSAIPVDEWGCLTQHTLWAWMTEETISDPGLGWPIQPSHVLRSLVEGIAFGIAYNSERFFADVSDLVFQVSRKGGHDTLRRLSPTQIYLIYRLAFINISKWPDKFRQFLQIYAPDEGVSIETSLGRFFKYWMKTRWSSFEYQFIHHATDDFVRDRRIFSKSAVLTVPSDLAFAYADQDEAAQITNISGCALQRLGQIGLIHRYRIRNPVCIYSYFLRQDLHELKPCWDQPLSLEDAAKWLGVSPKTLQELAKKNTLKTVSKEPNMLFPKSAVARLLQRIENRIDDFMPSGEDMFSLKEAAQLLYFVQITEAKLLKRVLNGRLQAYRQFWDDTWDIGSIWFPVNQLYVLLEDRLHEKGWMTLEDVFWETQVEENIVTQWIERGLLQPIAFYQQQPLLKRRNFEKFMAKYVFARDAIQIFGVTRTRISGWVRREQLKPVSGPDIDGCFDYLLPRKKTERLANRLKRR